MSERLHITSYREFEVYYSPSHKKFLLAVGPEDEPIAEAETQEKLEVKADLFLAQEHKVKPPVAVAVPTWGNAPRRAHATSYDPIGGGIWVMYDDDKKREKRRPEDVWLLTPENQAVIAEIEGIDTQVKQLQEKKRLLEKSLTRIPIPTPRVGGTSNAR